MQATNAAISALVGREVYTTNGVYAGEVEDVRMNLDRQSVTGLALTEIERTDLWPDHLKADGNGVLLPYRAVQSVGDVVLVHSTIENISQDSGE